MQTNNTLILEHLLKRRTITKAECYAMGYGISLNSRIADLRKLGYPICDRWLTHTNRNGKEVRYKEYYLDERFIEQHEKFVTGGR